MRTEQGVKGERVGENWFSINIVLEMSSFFVVAPNREFEKNINFQRL